MSRKRQPKSSPLAVGKELTSLAQIWLKHGVFGVPATLAKGVFETNVFGASAIQANIYRELGCRVLHVLSDLGPVYGKAVQMALSRINLHESKIYESMRLGDVYGNWPALNFNDIEDILDVEIPQWRQELRVERLPLGCASIAQVHAATDNDGREWVLKIVRPDAEKRLHQTVDAVLSLVHLCRPLAVTKTSERMLREIKTLCLGLRAELDLREERETIIRVQEKMTERKRSLIRVPEVHPTLASAKVLCVERFHGTKLSDIAEGKVELPKPMRQKLARKMLKELLIQVFEFGLFHGDPHAGNLMLLPDGAIGLFDWGLTGELLESDRAHIAQMLRAVMAMDIEKLAEALQAMAEAEGRRVELEKIKIELKKVARLVKMKKEKGQKVPLHRLINACLEAAQNLELHVPDGLVMMAKSLITIEGLAKGIDPDIRLGVVASPFFIKAAKPRIVDLLNLGRKAPQVIFNLARNR